MKSEHKELLLQDLCMRFLYNVKIEYNNSVCEVLSIDKYNEELTLCKRTGYPHVVKLYEVRPYLFPLSSMTEEQKEELFFNYIHNDIDFDDFTDYFLAGELWHDICVSMDILPELINWLNKNHLDWRGLIPLGLAYDATSLNIY
jgi:hypothetical protein